MSDLDPEAFNHFKEIPCDKCGSVCAYSNPEEVTECFGCKCKTLEENDVHCKCGWHGRWFKDVPYDENLQGRCPKCNELIDQKTANPAERKRNE